MNQAQLYTVIIEVYDTQEVFIHQLRTTKTQLNDILLEWVTQAVEQGFIKGTNDPKIPFRDITERNKHLAPLEGVSNVWRIEFNIGKDFYVEDVIRARHDGLLNFKEVMYVTVDFFKTAGSASVPIPSHKTSTDHDSAYVRQAEKKYAFYLMRYELLKSVPNLSCAINKERKQVERWMVFWDAKRKFHRQFFNRDARDEENELYTIVMYYRGGTYLRQFNDMPDGDVKLVLLVWANDVFRDMYKSKIIAPEDRLVLMEKLSQDSYTPMPVEGTTNVWATYASLTEGIAKLFVVKIATDNRGEV